MRVTAYIGLGSNLEQPIEQVRRALQELATIAQSRLVAHSSLYRSDPVGPPGQPDYINAVAALETELDAEALLDQLQQIEHQHQRRRLVHWGPRTLDLDLLLFGDRQINTSRLQVPHPFLNQRNFVIYPLYELQPELLLPDGSPLALLRRDCPMGTLEPIAL